SGLWCKLDEPNEHIEKFFLQDVSFVVHENSLTVMTAQVGSGKSTLWAAIAGEKFTKVLEACAMLENIKRFPRGDLTFVGERGTVLSG
ncbi:unnamed protein product, partial [Porites lobata]